MGTAKRIALLAALGSAVAFAAQPATKTTKESKETKSASTEGSSSEGTLDPRATDRLKEMSDFLGRQQSLALKTDGVVEVVTEDGQKLDIPYSSKVLVRRPNKLRVERVGEAKQRTLYYDGKTFTLYGKDANLYAQAPAPATLEQAMDTARDRLGVEAPAADLIYPNAYEGLMDGVTTATYVGEERIGGKSVEHLAFRGPEVDWQIWIEKGQNPLPLRYVITSKTVEGTPDFRVDLSNWDMPKSIPDEQFAFRPPAGAQKIEFKKHPEKGTGGAGQQPTEGSGQEDTSGSTEENP